MSVASHYLCSALSTFLVYQKAMMSNVPSALPLYYSIRTMFSLNPTKLPSWCCTAQVGDIMEDGVYGWYTYISLQQSSSAVSHQLSH